MSRISPELFARTRLQVYTRDSFACLHCGWTAPVPEGYDGSRALGKQIQKVAIDGEPYLGQWQFLELDHIRPSSLGGGFCVENLQTLCGPCNSRKGARV